MPQSRYHQLVSWLRNQGQLQLNGPDLLETRPVRSLLFAAEEGLANLMGGFVPQHIHHRIPGMMREQGGP